MFLYFSDHLIEFYSAFNAFTYITTRGILSALTALVVSFVFGPKLISLLEGEKIGEVIRDDGPESHSSKQGTPTMGGLLILVSIAISTIIWADLSNTFILTILISMLLFGLIGFIDDYMKLSGNKNGMKAIVKFILQLTIAFGAMNYLFYASVQPISTEVLIPFTNSIMWDIGWMFLPFTMLVIVGSSNAVNLTDGLDGLAIMPVVMISIALGIFAYVSGNFNFSSYLDLPFLIEAGEVFVICCAISGAGLGFLWFNTYPAQIFMGDTGSLAIGTGLAALSLATNTQLLLPIVAGLFVIETLSVIIQVTSFRFFSKRRVFKMAPLHHHFELSGWPETTVIVRFWIMWSLHRSWDWPFLW